MPICLPQQCLALVYGLPPPGDPLFRESPGWWVRLQSVGHRHRTCFQCFAPENFENFRKLFYAYMSTAAMPGPCVWAPIPWRSLVQGESRVVGQAAECSDAFPWGAWTRDGAVDTRKQAGRQSTALTGASSRSCHVTKRFRILATLKQNATKKYVQQHIGICTHELRLDWGQGIAGQ